MSFFAIAPEYVTSAATDLARIGTAIDEAGSAAASATTSVLAAGGDEVSAAIAALFSAHGAAYQGCVPRSGVSRAGDSREALRVSTMPLVRLGPQRVGRVDHSSG